MEEDDFYEPTPEEEEQWNREMEEFEERKRKEAIENELKAKTEKSAKKKTLSIYCSEDLYNELQYNADKIGINLSAFVIICLNDARKKFKENKTVGII